MGAVMEREQSYKDAAEHYEKAWKHENQASAQVGGSDCYWCVFSRINTLIGVFWQCV